MPSPLAHLAAGYSIYRIVRYAAASSARLAAALRPGLLLLPACLAFSMLPDGDSALGVLFRDMGAYHNQWSHSLFFALVPFTLVVLLAAAWPGERSPLAWGVLCLLSYHLHVVLDALCAGRGVMLFWPVTSQRYLLPTLPFFGLRWSEGVISFEHLKTLLNESILLAIFLPPLIYLTRLPPLRDSFAKHAAGEAVRTLRLTKPR